MRVIKWGWNGAAFDLQLVARNIVRSGMCVWDVGANQGIMAFLAASKVGPKGSVYALEADPRYADMIQRSARRLSATYEPVTVLCAAIAEHSGVLDFAVSAQGHARNRLLDHAPPSFEISARKSVVALSGNDLLVHWRAPDLIKMDVEGAELGALRGSESLFSGPRPVFYIEVSAENADTVTTFLRELDYAVFHLEGSGRERPVDQCTFYTIARPREGVSS